MRSSDCRNYGLDGDCMYSQRRRQSQAASNDAAAFRRRRYASREASFETTAPLVEVQRRRSEELRDDDRYDSFDGGGGGGGGGSTGSAAYVEHTRRRHLYRDQLSESIYTSTDSAPPGAQCYAGHDAGSSGRPLTSTEDDGDSTSTAYFHGGVGRPRYTADQMYREYEALEPANDDDYSVGGGQRRPQAHQRDDDYSGDSGHRYESFREHDNAYDSPANLYDSHDVHYDSSGNHYDGLSGAAAAAAATGNASLDYSLYSDSDYRGDSLDYSECKQTRYSDDAAFRIEGVVAARTYEPDYYHGGGGDDHPLVNKPRLQDDVIQEEESYHTDQDVPSASAIPTEIKGFIFRALIRSFKGFSENE